MTTTSLPVGCTPYSRWIVAEVPISVRAFSDSPQGESISSASVRVIPRLDIKGPNLVKGIHLEGLRALGKPEDFARHYYEQGADELLYMDVVASLYQRNSLLEFVSRTARETFIPMMVGGGLRTLDDIREVLRSGADKVCLNTAAINRPELLTEVAQRFGNQVVVLSVDARRCPSSVSTVSGFEVRQRLFQPQRRAGEIPARCRDVRVSEEVPHIVIRRS